LPRRARADLHVHPLGDAVVRDRHPDAFIAAAERAGIDLVALTDHDRIDVALDIVARTGESSVTFIVGQEISTSDGHLLGIGLRTRITPGRSMADSIAAVHDQGALAIVSHPLLPTKISIGGRRLSAIADGDRIRRPDALEGFNPLASWLPGYRRLLVRFAAQHGLPLVGGSDAHLASAVGRGFTDFGVGHAERPLTMIDLYLAVATGDVSGLGQSYGPRYIAAGLLSQLREGSVRLQG
jgi:predicted metal-dependent phosphoesterase TrpH